MITIFISTAAVLFGFLFLRDRKEEDIKPCWVKITFYFIALVIVSVFFYKTNQVITIHSALNIENYRSSYAKDDPNKVIDSIESINLYHHFASSTNNKAIRYLVDDDKFGSADLTIKAPKNTNYDIKDAALKDSINKMANILGIYPQYIGRMYQVIFSSSSVIPFIPVLMTDENFLEPEGKNDVIIRRFRYKNTYNPEGITEYKTQNGETADDFVKPTGLQKYYSKSGSLMACHNMSINSDLKFHGYIEGSIFDFFTAADISQYIFSFGMFSPCPVEIVSVEYDVPIEISSNNPDIPVGTFGFGITGQRLREMYNGQPINIHVKLPTMANLQLIRSFILTTLLAAIIALFLTSLGDTLLYYKSIGKNYLISKLLHKKTEKKTIPVLKEKRQFNIARNVMLVFLTTFVCYIAYRIYIDEPFVMTEGTYHSIITKMILFALLCMAILLFMYFRLLKKLN